ncbi:hypothetical protein JQC72_11590 [Polycladomyces sp. WAk]|uniref:Uncharacterized protein n=1 Tax=Polycladomyces zharkentensis TaxID=2807616 RepID=A0ABS2WKU2_9BACL|nr:hypothetical protein [Polycladomyces sp. WAk]MBN2910144.1 hypothetical protein [Polycladomyces sp. WAk]
MLNTDRRIITVEIKGALGDWVFLELANSSGSTLRAKVKKKGCFQWEIYLEERIWMGDRPVVGWVLKKHEHWKSRAVREAKTLLDRKWRHLHAVNPQQPA